MTARARAIAARVEAFVRDIVIPYERDPRIAVHGQELDRVTVLP